MINARASLPGPATQAQIRILAFAGFVKPLAAAPADEVRAETGLHGKPLTAVRNALWRRGLVDSTGAITPAGIAALRAHRPAHINQ